MKSHTVASQLISDYLACTQQFLMLATDAQKLEDPHVHLQTRQILQDLLLVGKVLSGAGQKKNIHPGSR